MPPKEDPKKDEVTPPAGGGLRDAGKMPESSTTPLENQIRHDEHRRGEVENEDLLRMTALLDHIRAGRESAVVKNVSYEVGRPRLKPVDSMVVDLTNPYSIFSLEHLIAIKPEPTSNNMATSEDIAKIFAELEGLGVPTEHVTRVILSMVLYYANASASKYMDPNGSITFGGGSVPRDTVHAIFNKHSTSRRVARLYAPMVWNHMLLHRAPPADWMAMGFPDEAKYAAFDFFDYVQNPAAIQVREGLIRAPTKAEKIAHKAHFRMATDRNARDDHFGNLDAEITGGVRGPSIRREYRQAK